MTLTKAFAATAVVSMSICGAAFAQSSVEGMSAGGALLSGNTAMQITDSDCQMLTVASARSACMRSVGSRMGTGATGDQGGVGRGGHGTPRMQKRSEGEPAHSNDGAASSR